MTAETRKMPRRRSAKGLAETVYFPSEGKAHRKETIRCAAERARRLRAKHFVVFTSRGDGAEDALEELQGTTVTVVAVTFISEKKFYSQKEGSDEFQATPVGISPQRRKKLEDAGAVIVRAALPFAEIPHAPHSADPKLSAIRSTLDLFGGGTTLCVQAVLMACDSGAIPADEDVVVCAADTAIVIKACHEEDLFTPWGLEIREVIAKPRVLTITKGMKQA
jgi:hypothetical protein